MRAIGASLDWSRYAYTMDDKRQHAVMEAFIRMYQAGLIYRGNRIVNWDPKGRPLSQMMKLSMRKEKPNSTPLNIQRTSQSLSPLLGLKLKLVT